MRLLRARLLALGMMTTLLTATHAQQPAELPPIFLPRPDATANAIPAGPPRREIAGPGISTRMRGLMTGRILADAKAFEAPVAASNTADGPTLTSDGAVLMPRFLVKSLAPRRDEVEPPELPLGRFAPLDSIERRVKGYSATLFRSPDGSRTIDLNLLNGAGNGIDHNRDFVRVEVGFTLRF